jgi:dynein heavy chain
MTKEVKDNIAKMCVHVHESVSVFTEKFFQLMRRRVYSTPKSYLDLVDCYKNLLIKKRDQLTNNK